MSKKAKRKVDPRVQRVQLQQRRHMIENELFRTMLRMLKACDAYELFMKLPAVVHKRIKTIQFRSLVIKAAKGCAISDAVIAAVKKDLSKYLHTEKVTFEGTGEQFTLYEVITAGQTLWLEASAEKQEATWAEIHQRLAPLNQYFDADSEALFLCRIADFLRLVVVPLSHIDKYYLWTTWKYERIGNHLASVFRMHRENCQRKHLVIDHKSRPVFRVGYPVQMKGVVWAGVKGEKLLSLCPRAQGGREYPVYVQSHALQRLKERLVPLPDLEERLMEAYWGCDVSRGPAGSLFFAVKYCGQKVGYLLTDFTGSELVGRSFLFITNTGTAEGFALNERLRVEAYSKKYFGLDSLMTYLFTDLCTDPFFGAILKECGCEGLVNIKQWLLKVGVTGQCKYSENLRRVLALEDQEQRESGVSQAIVFEQAREAQAVPAGSH